MLPAVGAPEAEGSSLRGGDREPATERVAPPPGDALAPNSGEGDDAPEEEGSNEGVGAPEALTATLPLLVRDSSTEGEGGAVASGEGVAWAEAEAVLDAPAPAPPEVALRSPLCEGVPVSTPLLLREGDAHWDEVGSREIEGWAELCGEGVGVVVAARVEGVGTDTVPVGEGVKQAVGEGVSRAGPGEGVEAPLGVAPAVPLALPVGGAEGEPPPPPPPPAEGDALEEPLGEPLPLPVAPPRTLGVRVGEALAPAEAEVPPLGEGGAERCPVGVAPALAVGESEPHPESVDVSEGRTEAVKAEGEGLPVAAGEDEGDAELPPPPPRVGEGGGVAEAAAGGDAVAPAGREGEGVAVFAAEVDVEGAGVELGPGDREPPPSGAAGGEAEGGREGVPLPVAGADALPLTLGAGEGVGGAEADGLGEDVGNAEGVPESAADGEAPVVAVAAEGVGKDVPVGGCVGAGEAEALGEPDGVEAAEAVAPDTVAGAEGVRSGEEEESWVWAAVADARTLSLAPSTVPLGVLDTVGDAPPLGEGASDGEPPEGLADADALPEELGEPVAPLEAEGVSERADVWEKGAEGVAVGVGDAVGCATEGVLPPLLVGALLTDAPPRVLSVGACEGEEEDVAGDEGVFTRCSEGVAVGVDSAEGALERVGSGVAEGGAEGEPPPVGLTLPEAPPRAPGEGVPPPEAEAVDAPLPLGESDGGAEGVTGGEALRTAVAVAVVEAEPHAVVDAEGVGMEGAAVAVAEEVGRGAVAVGAAPLREAPAVADAAAEAVGAALPEAAAVPVEAPKTLGDTLALTAVDADAEALPPPPLVGLLLALPTLLAEALPLSRAVPEAEGEPLWEGDAPPLREVPHVRDTVALALAQGVMEGDGGGVPEREGEGVPEGEGGEEALTPPAGLRLSRGVALAQPPLTLAERDGEAVADSLRTDGEGVSEAPGEAVSAPLGEARLEDEARAVT
jgi:hypothetical protein